MKKILLVLFLAGMSAITASAQQRFVAALTPQQEVPPANSTAKGTCTIVLNASETQITVNCTYSGLTTPPTGAHIHGNVPPGTNAGILFDFGAISGTSGTIGPLNFNVTPAQVANMRAHRWYVNIHSQRFLGGEIRGQIKQVTTVSDYDGDGRTDAVVFRQSTNTVWVRNSLNNPAFTQITHGTGSGDTFLRHTWDFDGDGLADPVLIKTEANGLITWRIFQSNTNTVRTVQWGDVTLNDQIAPADYDGDGIEDIAVYRRSTGHWWVIRSSDGARTATLWGNPGTDSPVIGDYDGDGRADLTIVRIEGNDWIWWTLFSSTGGFARVPFGSALSGSGIIPSAPIDVDGDGKQDRMVFNTVNEQIQFNFLRSSDFNLFSVTWGLATDARFLGDYDGDGRTDIAMRRDVSGQYVWHILLSSTGYSQSQPQYVYWGITGDQ